jgi:hypothetical protein
VLVELLNLDLLQRQVGGQQLEEGARRLGVFGNEVTESLRAQAARACGRTATAV